MDTIERIRQESEADNIKNNRVIIAEGAELKLINSEILFKGQGNILYIAGCVRFENSTLTFNQNDSVAFFCGTQRDVYYLNATLNNSSVLYIGKNNYFNSKMILVLSEHKHIWIGDDGCFSAEIMMRNSDAHPLYDAISRQRINYSKSIFLGDHIWLGQGVFVGKGVKIGSGSVIAANATVTNTTVPSNCVFGGVPAKKIREHTFFLKNSVHKWTEEDTESKTQVDSDAFVYSADENTLCFDDIDEALDSAKTAEEKAEYIISINNCAKNRYFIPMKTEN